MEFAYDGASLGKGGNATLFLDGVGRKGTRRCNTGSFMQLHKEARTARWPDRDFLPAAL